jgi:hypothetical protein
MTDVERTTTRETQATQPAVDAYGNPAPAPAVTNVRTTESAYVARGPGGASVAGRVVTLVFGVLQALLILRIILLVLVANAGNDVVRLIFNVTQPFVDPFLGMFALNRVTADQGSTFDIAALVALIGWTLVELLILAAIRIFARRPSEV